MKIIARIDGNTLVVEMTERELANVAGYNLESQVPSLSWRETFQSGTEFHVSPAWTRLQQQERAAEQLEGVSKTLAALSDLVTQTKVAYTNCTSEAPKTEGGAS